MKQKFLYIFGFQTPKELKSGWGDESSGAVFIAAENEGSALQWGHEIATKCVKQVFGITWSSGDYAAFIDMNEKWQPWQVVGIPTVEVGHFPDPNSVFQKLRWAT